MSIVINGMGWVTPLGADLQEVWTRLQAGERPETKELTGPAGTSPHRYLPVPPKVVEYLGRQPRLRRSSPISYYAVAAALQALAQAGVEIGPGKTPARLAVIFAATNGSVVYTRKFYEGYKKGNPASPLLFPETVYNAPASHVAAALGIDGASYTLVGDTSVGLSALKLAEQLLLAEEVDHCLVVGGEELDWVLCDAYRTWRLATDEPMAARTTPGALLAEAGAALLLSRTGTGPHLAKIHPGRPYFSRAEAPAAVQAVVAELAAFGTNASVAVLSTNGTPLDAAEIAALAISLPQAILLHPKASLGEAMGASALLQVMVAALAMGPSGQNVSACAEGVPENKEVAPQPFKRALVLASGINQQASGAIVAAAEAP